MGCDIHSFVEVKKNNKWECEKSINPFNARCYSKFAFLAGVRNYDHCEPLSEQKGLPNDVSDFVKSDFEDWGPDAHSESWLTLKELLDFDYDKTLWNRRVMKTIDGTTTGAALAEEGEGEVLSYRENLGAYFFEELEILKSLGDPESVRVVFWFDN